MTDAFHTLHLIGVNPDKRALAIRGVKAALSSSGDLGDEDVWEQAVGAVRAVLSGGGPVGLVRDLPATVKAAQRAFTAALDGNDDAATLALNLDTSGSQAPPPPEAGRPERSKLTLTLGGPIRFESAPSDTAPPADGEPWTRKQIEHQFVAETPDDFEPCYQAARAALVLMASTDGKAANAWYYAKALGCATEDVELWVEVGNLIAETFGFEKGTE